MSDQEQVRRFADEIDKVVERFRSEYDMTLAAIVGTLTVTSHALIKEAIDDQA